MHKRIISHNCCTQNYKIIAFADFSCAVSFTYSLANVWLHTWTYKIAAFEMSHILQEYGCSPVCFFHVNQQSRTTPETFPACFARKGLLACVDSDMSIQYWLLIKSFTTDVTRKWLLARVSSFMDVQYWRLVKSLSANVARIRPLACVDSFMNVQYGCLIESFTTDVARIWPHARVDSQVSD